MRQLKATVIFVYSARNHSIISPLFVRAWLGSHVGQANVLLAGGQVLFGESLVLTRLKMSEIIRLGTMADLAIIVRFDYYRHLQQSKSVRKNKFLVD